MQEQDDVSVERVRNRRTEDHFEPEPAGLIHPPHEQSGRHERPEKPRVTSTIDRISDGENKRGCANQKRDHVPYCNAKKWAWKNDRGQDKDNDQSDSADSRRDGTKSHFLA